MTTDIKHQAFEVISEFEIEAVQQQTFVDAIADQVEQHFKRYPGFVSARFYASDDGQRVAVSGQWHSKEAWENIFRKEGFQPPTREIVQRFGAKPLGFQLARSISNEQ